MDGVLVSTERQWRIQMVKSLKRFVGTENLENVGNTTGVGVRGIILL